MALEQGYGGYYAQGVYMAIRGLFSYNDQPLFFRRADKKRLSERNRKTEDYSFDKSGIASLSMVGNLRERYVLRVGKSLGRRAGDFVI